MYDVFLTIPTINELRALELPVLIDMLVKQTAIYTKMLRQGFAGPTDALKDLIVNIQAAIEAKRKEVPPSPHPDPRDPAS